MDKANFGGLKGHKAAAGHVPNASKAISKPMIAPLKGSQPKAKGSAIGVKGGMKGLGGKGC